MDYRWTCTCCGETHYTLPMSYGVNAPRNWFDIPEAERSSRVRLDQNLCVIDGREFYVRGCIEVPVMGIPEKFVWGVWVSVSMETFRHILDKWDAEIGDDEPPRFGWLCTWLTGYPDPHGVRCHVYLRSNNLRPRVVLQPTDYPLAVEQHAGITIDRVKEIAAGSGHGGD